MKQALSYLNGFHQHISSEALPQVIPKGQNSPQQVPYGLYAEQISGNAFTMPRHLNLHSWLYRIRPSVVHGQFQATNHLYLSGIPTDATCTPPTQMRWDPMPYPETASHFISGLKTFAANGSIDMQMGAAIHLYAANTSMETEYFYNADGEFLIVPQEGELLFKTEFGLLDVKPGEIILIPRGIKFQVELLSERARGYVCENFGCPFRLPERGIIGANGLASERDFQSPVAAYEEKLGQFTLLVKFRGQLWQTDIQHSPLDVVAWHGNYLPCKYDLRLFNTINTVSFDHPDPSIYTVLTSPSHIPHTANVDFVIFPPRWMVAEHTFRLPYFHRNIMSEFMGLIDGTYDAKQSGFLPGGCSLHNCMSAHGPDEASFNAASTQSLSPEYYNDTLAFMFEAKQIWQLTPFAYHAPFKQKNYLASWENLKSHFKLNKIHSCAE